MNGGLHAVSVGKPSEQMSNFWSVRFSKPNTNQISVFSTSIVSNLVNNRLFKTALDIDEPPFQFIHTIDLSVVDTMLHDSPDLVVHKTEIWAL